jgi:hypothetical protein
MTVHILNSGILVYIAALRRSFEDNLPKQRLFIFQDVSFLQKLADFRVCVVSIQGDS